MPDLSLELTFRKTQVVCCESIPFTVTLTNTGGAAQTVTGLGNREGTLSLLAETGGKLIKVSQHEMVANLGEGHVHERNPTKIELKPGEATSADGDALAWFGTLSPGTYSMWATYFGSPTATAESLKATVTVKEVNPVALYTSGDGARLSLTARRLTWLNKTAQGYEVYFTELEARRPVTILSSRGVDRLPSATPVFSSIENISSPPATYVIWRAGPGMRGVRIDQAGNAAAFELLLPDGSLLPVGSPVCLESGSMAMWCAGLTGESAALILADASGKVRSVQVEPGTPLGRCRASCIDRKEAAHLVWSSPDHAAVHTVGVGALAERPSPVRKIWTTTDRILHVRADVLQEEETDADVVVATVLSHDDVNDIFTFARINIANGERFAKDLKVTHVGSGFLEVVGSTMTRAGDVSYLFAKPDKTVHYAGPGLTEIRPLLAEYTNPLTTSMFPVILASSPLAKEPGVALVYIREGKTIERRMLPE